MIDSFIMGVFVGGVFTYLLLMSWPDKGIDWRETVLSKLTCADCDKQVALLEFQLHGGLCEECFKKRHGYNQSSVTKANGKTLEKSTE